MGRSGYTDDFDDNFALIRWRGAVKKAINGKRGQAFLREMLAALDAMPEKRLIRDALHEDGEVCAIGAPGRARGIDMSKLDPEEPDQIAKAFGISRALVCEIEFTNDDDFSCDRGEKPEKRFERVRKWVVSQIREVSPEAGAK